MNRVIKVNKEKRAVAVWTDQWFVWVTFQPPVERASNVFIDKIIAVDRGENEADPPLWYEGVSGSEMPPECNDLIEVAMVEAMAHLCRLCDLINMKDGYLHHVTAHYIDSPQLAGEWIVEAPTGISAMAILRMAGEVSDGYQLSAVDVTFDGSGIFHL